MRQWKYTDVVAEVARSFPQEDQETILEILNEYHNNERARVQMAILKISQGNIDQLLTYTSAACLDYRDVLMWSEM